MVEVQVKRRKIYKNKILKILRLGISYIVLVIMAIVSIFPLYYVIITSFSNSPALETLSVSSLIPNHLYITAYEELFSSTLAGASFLLWLRNSLILAGSTAILTIILTLITGYALSRLNYPAKKILATFIYILTFLPFTATAVPLYILFARLHLLNYIGLILAYASGTSIFTSFVAKLGIDSIPTAYEEIAMIDGLSRFQVLLRIVMRLALPYVVFAAILGFDGAYLDFALSYAFLFTNSNLWTGLIGLYFMAGLINPAAAPAYNVFSAGAVIMGIPIMAVFLASFRIMTRAYSTMGGVKQ